jgi:hypothetical protein
VAEESSSTKSEPEGCLDAKLTFGALRSLHVDALGTRFHRMGHAL